MLSPMKVPLSRWARLALGMPSFVRTGQIGDGREAACAAYVEAHSRPGDIDAALSAINTFAYKKAMLVNVGVEKGELLDAAVRRTDPALVLELGTYCGYSALRIARAAPLPNSRSSSLPDISAEPAIRRRTFHLTAFFPTDDAIARRPSGVMLTNRSIAALMPAGRVALSTSPREPA